MAQQFNASTHTDGSHSFDNGGACLDSKSSAGPSPGPHPHPPPSLDPATVTIKLDDLGLGFSGPAKVRDVWGKKDLAVATGTLSATVPHHGSAFFVLMPPATSWPPPFELAPWMKIPPPPVPSGKGAALEADLL